MPQFVHASQAWVLEQVFALPVVVIQQKAFVGGKSVANTGGLWRTSLWPTK